MPKLELHFLGQFHVTLDSQPITTFKTDKARALLAYLVIEGNQAHPRDSLTSLLWPEYSADHARADLRQTLHRLRDALGDQRQLHPFLLTNTDTIQLNSSSDYWVDVIEFGRLLTACEQHRHRHIESCHMCATRLAQAVALYRGDFLAGVCVADSSAFSDWLIFHQEYLHRQLLAALQQLVVYHLHQGEWATAEIYLHRQLKLEAWHEPAHRQLMQLYAATGRRSEAIAQYDRCRRALLEQLAMPPDAETTALMTSIRNNQSFALPVPRLLNMPQQQGTLVGRTDELARIRETLQHPECHMLTLVGLGGSGKTRLAIEAAAREARSFRDGACFCSLAQLGPAEPPAPTLAQALGIGFADVHDAQVQVVQFLHQKEMLLVLDNVEHLPAAEWIAHLLRTAPRVVILATSRHPLGIRDEWRIEVRGLAYPEIEPSTDWLETLRYPSVQLFVQRAEQTRPGFQLTEQTAPDIVRICRQVEGMPLALQLAASWSGLMSCPEIADAIDKSLDFLQVPWGDVPLRQRGMRATFDYSWSLLAREEQDAFACLSIFRGEFCHAAARAVIGGPCALRCLQGDAIGRPVPSGGCLFKAFVEKAMLQEVTPGLYRLQSLLRQYAEEKLAQRESEQHMARTRYCDYVVGLADRAESEENHKDYWHKRLLLERQNLQMALSWESSLGTIRPGAIACLTKVLTGGS